MSTWFTHLFCIINCYFTHLAVTSFPTDYARCAPQWPCVVMSAINLSNWIQMWLVTPLATVSCYICFGHTLSLYISVQHMIITFSDWPTATHIRITGAIYIIFICLCGQITVGLLLGETFSCVVEWPVLEWVLKIKALGPL